MADTPAPIDPDRILEHSFTAVRRGYDPLEVQRYLLQIANQLRSGRDREAELRHTLDEAEKRTAPIDELDPSQLTRLLGQETARVLEAAQSASSEIRGKAEENVARMLREARDESQQMHEDADTVLGRKTAEAEEAAAAIRAEAETVIEKARTEAAELVEAGRQEGREMVAEAQKVRQRMLDDLARRRKQLRQQIEQLQAGRERLLGAYEVVRETLDVATEELHVALPEAKLAAESASLKAADDDEAAFAAEIDEAVAAGAIEAEAEVEVAVATEMDAVAGSERDETPAEAGDDPTLGAHEQVGSDLEDAEELAPDPVEGRHSSSVRVVRAGVAGDKAADVFARLRQEDGEDDEDTEPLGEGEGEAHDDVVAEPEAEPTPAEETVAEETAAADETDAVAPDAVDEAADPALELLVRRDAAVAELERNLARRLKRELSDEQNELLASLTAAKGVPTAADVLPAPEAHVERFQAISLPSLAAAATAGADLVSTVAGPPAAPTSVSDLAAEVAAEIVAPLRERLERAFADFGGHPDDVAQSIRSCYREWKGQRVDQVASHAVVAACNRGLVDRLPEGTLVRWVVDDGDSPSPDCDDNALAGAVVRGEAFPTGHTAPPVHPACRCMVVPVDA